MWQTFSLTNGSVVATGESGSGECKIRLWKEDYETITTSTLTSTRRSLASRLNSGFTGMQVIALGITFMICWQLFVALWRMFLDAGGFLLLGKSVLNLWKVCGPVRLCRQILNVHARLHCLSRITMSTFILPKFRWLLRQYLLSLRRHSQQ